MNRNGWWWLSLVFALIAGTIFGGCDCDDDDDDCDCGDDDDDNDDDTGGDDDSADDDTQAPLLAWVTIAAGSFEMGCSAGDDLCNPDEQPSHTINVSDFQITPTEVTQAQWLAFAGFNPSHFTAENGFDDCPDCPVENVSWYEAKSFCEAMDGRLPSEAEWEYATRAGTTARFVCGQDAACLDDIAWYDQNADERTHAVAGKAANDFGLYDTIGNVWEWINDWYSSTYYDNSPTNDPPGAEVGSFRVLRGGSWQEDPDAHMTVSDRYLHDPLQRFPHVGFRCAR